MPDPVMNLVEQHNQVRRLFKQVPQVGAHQSAEHRALAICDLLTIHSRLEEEIVYPAIENVDAAMAKEAEEAHERIDALIDNIRNAEYADNGEVKSDLESLDQEVEAHVQWEEATLLPRVSALPAEEQERIWRAMYARQQELLQEHSEALSTSAETEGFIAAPRI
ncbi:MAG: hemerythrin domain-containing protein [Actinomycetota bacterium]|nr:hemerythrin domain-containing protein [Actinomycetota bacterium]